MTEPAAIPPPADDGDPLPAGETFASCGGDGPADPDAVAFALAADGIPDAEAGPVLDDAGTVPSYDPEQDVFGISRGRARWLAAGSPQYGIAQPAADLAHTLRGYGIEVGTYGNRTHQLAATPEDHTLYSATGWPTAALLGWCYADDVMPKTAPGLPNNAQLMGQIVRDKSAGVAGTEAIKYINWTDEAGNCWHEAWDPTHRRGPSGDRGHGHISFRTDFLHWAGMAGYDPVARWRAAHQPGGIVVPVVRPVTIGPPFPGRTLRLTRPMMHGVDVRTAQQRLKDRGWAITVDGWYGNESADVVGRFQADSSAHGWPLGRDRELGPKTWTALWARPKS